MKIIHLTHSDGKVGADRSAYRIHNSLTRSGIDSTMWVSRKVTNDNTVIAPTKKLGELISMLRNHLPDPLTRRLKTSNRVLHSPSILPSGWIVRLNQSDADIIHLHWPHAEMISIEDIGRIKKPIVWTLHDMWAFCGAEHYTEEFRWRNGYHKDNRPNYESGFDLNRWTWLRKQRSWKTAMNIVCPSQWLAECSRSSALLNSWPHTVIPYPINTDQWQPTDMIYARSLLGLPLKVPLVLFGAMRGGQDLRKGFDLLVESLHHLSSIDRLENIELVVFGESQPISPPQFGFTVHYLGYLHDDISLKALYSAASVVVIPSRQDNLPNVGIEALACGAPIASFNTGGLKDIVTHKQTGYLAQSFDAQDLARGIDYIISPSNQMRLRHESRAKALRMFHPSRVSNHYKSVYEQSLNRIDKYQCNT